MAQLIVRHLDESVKAGLRARALRHGRSMEEEVRDILRASVAQKGKAKEGLGDRFVRRFSGIGLDEDIPEMRGQKAKPAKFKN